MDKKNKAKRIMLKIMIRLVESLGKFNYRETQLNNIFNKINEKYYK
jgi:hypothetical protein